jgi:hypothetical protein
MGRGGGSAQRHAELLANRCTNGIYVTIHISSQSRDFPAGLGRLRAGRMGVTSSSAGTRKRLGCRLLPLTSGLLVPGHAAAWVVAGLVPDQGVGQSSFWVGSSAMAWLRGAARSKPCRIPTPSWSGTPQDQVSHPTCRSLSTARLRGLPCRLGVRLEAGAASHRRIVLRRCVGA